MEGEAVAATPKAEELDVKVPTLEEIGKAVEDELKTADIETLTIKQVRVNLESKFGCDLKPFKAFIKEELQRLMDAGEAAAAEKEEDEEKGAAETTSSSDEDSDDDDLPPASEKKKKKRGGGAFGSTPLQLSAELFDFISGEGLSNESTLARSDVIKHLWAYIKANQLQDPTNGRKIVNDDKLQAVFKCKKMDMFSMQKKLSAHLKNQGDLVSGPGEEGAAAAAEEGGDGDGDGTGDERGEKEEGEDEAPPKKRARKPTKKKAAEEEEAAEEGPSKGKAKGKGKKKKKAVDPNAPPKVINHPKYHLSEHLSKVVGSPIMSRPEIIKQLWVYIRANGCQNPSDKREIICDAKLRAVFSGEDSVTMFSMNKYISAHVMDRVQTT